MVELKEKTLIGLAIAFMAFLVLISAIGIFNIFNAIGVSADERRLNYIRSAVADPSIREEYYREILNNMVYLKDERTGLCFSYHWGGGSDGGPAISRIDCDLELQYFSVDDE